MKVDAKGRDEGAAGKNSDGMSPALRSMIAEVRAEKQPDLRWDAVEKRLMDRLARGEGGARQSRGGEVLRALVPLCAAAASIALGLSFGASSSAPEAADAAEEARHVDMSAIAMAPGLAGDRGDHDASLLHVGDAVEGKIGGAPIAFARAGVVRWTLSPRARVVVIDEGARNGVGMALALERGSIRAEVEPRDPAEGLVDAFAIEVGGTRVAVHGTAFTVTREELRLVVDVEHGVVAVGPRGHRGATAGYSLVGPARASFSLDGGSEASFLPRDDDQFPTSAIAEIAPLPQPVEASVAGSHTEPHVAHPIEHALAPEPSGRFALEAPAAAPPALLPAAPVASNGSADSAPAQAETAPEAQLDTTPKPAVRLTASGIKSNIERCIKDAQRERLTSTKLFIASTLTITVDDSGAIKTAKLDPPLAPHLRQCAGLGIAGKFASGPQTITIPLSVVEE